MEGESKRLADLSDGEIQTLVGELSADVQQRRTEVNELQSSLDKLKVSIHDQQHIRQQFTEELFKAEQAVPLIESNRRLREELKKKQAQLVELTLGEARDQQYVQELQERLSDLQKEAELSDLSQESRDNANTLKELERSYQEASEAYQSTKAELERVEHEVAQLRLKQKLSSGEKQSLTLDQKIDKLLMKYSKKAGLKLAE